MIVNRYLAREIFWAVAFVLAALLSLFFFIDFLTELDSVRGAYKASHAALYVLLEIPANAYQLMPVATLIGAIVALAQFAANSEFTIMRVSGFSSRQAAWSMVKAGALIAPLTFVVGEYLMPPAQAYAEKMKFSRLGSSAPLTLRSGFWVKDLVFDQNGSATGTRFVNAAKVLVDGSLLDVRVYEFDAQARLISLAQAKNATYSANQGWALSNLTETRFISSERERGLFAGQELVYRTELVKEVSRVWPARIDANALASVFVDPTRMSALSLWRYIQHLKRTHQNTTQHDYALWRKVVYPSAVWVMLLLALPFAYLHTRSGGVSFKIFAGVMVGIVFYLANSLAQHLGVLNNWPPVFTLLPTVLALLGATFWLRWVSRH